jgi:hypothetical protein
MTTQLPGNTLIRYRASGAWQYAIVIRTAGVVALTPIHCAATLPHNTPVTQCVIIGTGEEKKLVARRVISHINL